MGKNTHDSFCSIKSLQETQEALTWSRENKSVMLFVTEQGTGSYIPDAHQMMGLLLLCWAWCAGHPANCINPITAPLSLLFLACCSLSGFFEFPCCVWRSNCAPEMLCPFWGAEDHRIVESYNHECWKRPPKSPSPGFDWMPPSPSNLGKCLVSLFLNIPRNCDFTPSLARLFQAVRSWPCYDFVV